MLTCGLLAMPSVVGQTENSYWEGWPRRSESAPAALTSRSPSTSRVLVFPLFKGRANTADKSR